MKYSMLRKTHGISETNELDDRFAHLTHFLHNGNNGASSAFRRVANEFLNPVPENITNFRDDEIQYMLPTVFDVPFPPPVAPEFTFIDLFAGIGGFRIPLQENNGKCLFSSEFNQQAKRTYEHNFGEVPFGDITRLNLDLVPKHDVLTAGFPCQPFSISGKMKGFEDTRGTLIHNVFQIIKKCQPKVVILENVKHLIHHDGSRTLKTILKHLDEMGYQTSWELLNASDYGVPQNRERIIIIGHRTKKFDFTKLEKTEKKPLKPFLEKKVDFEYLNESYTILEEIRPQQSGLIFIGYRNKKIRKAGVRPGTENLSRVHKQPNRIYSVNGIHPALPSQESSGRFWIYDGKAVRKLTINECFRIMGFPDNFVKVSALGDLYRQIGNSVCVPMVSELMKQVKAQLL